MISSLFSSYFFVKADRRTDPSGEGKIQQCIGRSGRSIPVNVSEEEPAQTGMSLTANNWSRLTHEVCQRVLEKTGNEEFAKAMGWGGVASVAQEIAPASGFLSKIIPVPYKQIAEPFFRVIDSIVSDDLAGQIVDEGVEYISRRSEREKKQ